jgi:hypothetical protein
MRMNAWTLKASPASEPAGEPCLPYEEALPEAPVHALRAAPVPRDSGLEDPYRVLHQSLIHVEIDEGNARTVPLAEGSARAFLDATQTLRDRRERERAVLAPVYNFGGDRSASGEW